MKSCSIVSKIIRSQFVRSLITLSLNLAVGDAFKFLLQCNNQNINWTNTSSSVQYHKSQLFFGRIFCCSEDLKINCWFCPFECQIVIFLQLCSVWLKKCYCRFYFPHLLGLEHRMDKIASTQMIS